MISLSLLTSLFYNLYFLHYSKLLFSSIRILKYRSPNSYKDLRDGGYLVLPSQRILRYHKNKVKQAPGKSMILFDFVELFFYFISLPLL